jgi:hypothetical protein
MTIEDSEQYRPHGAAVDAGMAVVIDRLDSIERLLRQVLQDRTPAGDRERTGPDETIRAGLAVPDPPRAPAAEPHEHVP